MTKHLRLLMLALLAIVCMGGYSQTKSVVYTIGSTPSKASGELNIKWAMPKNGSKDTQDPYRGYGWNNSNTKSASIKGTIEKAVTIKKIIVNANSNSNGSVTNRNYIAVSVGGIDYGKEYLSKGNPANGKSNVDKVYEGSTFSDEFNINLTIGSKSIWIKTVTIEYEEATSDLTATTIAFAEGIENSIVTVKDGGTFEGYKATCTTEGAKGAIQYSSSNTDVATVDESTGAVTMGSKYGKTVITAQFIGTGGYANSNKISYTIEYKGAYAFYESFDKCASVGGNSGGWNSLNSGSILSDKLTDVAGWSFASGKESDKCARFGTGEKKGSATTPQIALERNAELTFKAGSWKGDNRKLVISVTAGTLTYNGNTAKTQTISLADAAWETYSMIISGTSNFKITFAAATDNNNRFFLDEVMVKEISAADVTLDEDKDNVVEAAENANITLKRTLYADGGWNTLCLPFSLTDAQAKAAFGDDVELRTLESVSGNTLTFAKATGITAGVPCLIKVSKVAENNTYTFTGVSVKAIKADADKYDVDESLTFVGIYAPMDVATAFEKDGNALFLGAANKFYKAKAGTTMKAFRAFFLVPASTDTQALRAVIDGTTTGIDDLNIDTVKADGRVYNLNGQCVGYSLEGLKAGIYIQNGKKVIKK